MSPDAPASGTASLADLVARDGPMDPRRAAVLGIELCGLLTGDRAGARRVAEAGALGLAAGRLQWIAAATGPTLSADPGLPSAARSVARLLYFLATAVHPDDSPPRIRDVRPGLPPAFAQVVDRWMAVTGPPPPARRRGPPELWRGRAERRRREELATLASELSMACGLSTADAARTEVSGQGQHGPGRRRLPMPAVAVLALFILALGVLAAAGRLAAMRDAATPVPPAGFSIEGALVLRGLEEQGDALVRRDDFFAATQAYTRLTELAHRTLGGESLVEGWHEVKLSWVRHLSWDYTGAAQHARVGLGMIDRTAPKDHPYRSMALAMMGLAETQQGAFESAGTFLSESLRARAAALGLEPPPPAVLTRLESALIEVPAHWEWDEDGLIDIFEIALGSDRKSADSDRDGTLDVDEDADGDGVPDGVLYSLGFDPSRVIAHRGGIDPQHEGFWRLGRLTAGPGAGPSSGWRARSTATGSYAVPFTSAQQRASRVQGWRVMLLVSIDAGTVTAAIDPAPVMSGFELRATRTSDSRVAVSVSGAPRSVTVDVDRNSTLGLELLYDAVCDCARLRRRGEVLLAGIRGVPGGSGRWGFTFGVAGTSEASADATFRTALLEIRH